MALSLDARRRRNDDGFTLIELLIVIIILGILAAIVVFSVKGITDKGTSSACKTSVSTIDTAFEAYAAGLPNPSTADPAVVDLDTLKTGGFLHSVPTKVGGTAVTGATKVSAVDAIAC